MQLHVQRFEGFFSNPSYFFGSTGAGGTAQRIDFLDAQRAVATGANYTSCPSDGSGGPAWLLSTDRVKMDFEANEGIAENAVLRFYGVPILAAPVLSFPLTDERKSGWLPPSINLDSKSGLQVSVPYYWNIAPQRDATLTPIVSAKRGLGADSEFRYLEPQLPGRRTGPRAAQRSPDRPLALRARTSRTTPTCRATRCWVCACCASPTTTTGRTSRGGAEHHAAPAGQRSPGGPPAGRRLDRSMRACSAGRCCRSMTQPVASSRPTSARRRWVRAGSRRAAGGLQVAFETEVNRFVNPQQRHDHRAHHRRARCTRSAAWTARSTTRAGR